MKPRRRTAPRDDAHPKGCTCLLCHPTKPHPSWCACVVCERKKPGKEATAPPRPRKPRRAPAAVEHVGRLEVAVADASPGPLLEPEPEEISTEPALLALRAVDALLERVGRLEAEAVVSRRRVAELETLVAWLSLQLGDQRAAPTDAEELPVPPTEAPCAGSEARRPRIGNHMIPPEKRETLIGALREGKSTREAAELAGVNRNTAASYRRDLEAAGECLPRPRYGHPPKVTPAPASTPAEEQLLRAEVPPAPAPDNVPGESAPPSSPPPRSPRTSSPPEPTRAELEQLDAAGAGDAPAEICALEGHDLTEDGDACRRCALAGEALEADLLALAEDVDDAAPSPWDPEEDLPRLPDRLPALDRPERARIQATAYEVAEARRMREGFYIEDPQPRRAPAPRAPPRPRPEPSTGDAPAVDAPAGPALAKTEPSTDAPGPTEETTAPAPPPSGPAYASGLTREQRRSRRHHAVRAHTISVKRLSKRELEIGRLMYPERVEHSRPKTRGECLDGARPCPYVSCHHHLYLDVSERTGAIKINFPDREVWEMGESCALDVAERGYPPGTGKGGGVTLEEAGVIMNLTRERIRQVETRAMAKLEGLPVVMALRDDLVEGGGPTGKRRLPVLEAPGPDEEDEDLDEEETDEDLDAGDEGEGHPNEQVHSYEVAS